LVQTVSPPVADQENDPDVVIIGGGIGGFCCGQFAPWNSFYLCEQDDNFEARSQVYGLTLQQASKAIEGLGIFSLEKGVISTRHVVHTTDEKIIGKWGIRKWIQSDAKTFKKRTNINIAQQSLRLTLAKHLGGHDEIHWAHHY
jgi:2-polyprenyl-6-methoxyphenol hydroxylase-like FAD-dependent oxidoreductase